MLAANAASEQKSSPRAAVGAAANVTGFIFLEKGNHVVALGWWNGTRDVLIERAEGSRVVRPFRGLRKPCEDPYLVALEAERRADLLRREAGLPPAITFAEADGGDGPVRRGPKTTHPECAALSTFWNIGQLCRISLILAHGDLPPEECEMILASLPAELREDFRLIIWRHRRYGRRQTLSRAAVNELVRGVDYIRDLRNRKPDSDTWTREEWGEQDYVVELTAARNIPVTLEGSERPAYVRGLWKRLDEWGAARHRVTLPTFRSWRTKLRKAGLLATPPPRGRAKRVRDN
jgi:acetyl esterase